jgi:hypothetical protein
VEPPRTPADKIPVLDQKRGVWYEYERDKATGRYEPTRDKNGNMLITRENKSMDVNHRWLTGKLLDAQKVRDRAALQIKQTYQKDVEAAKSTNTYRGQPIAGGSKAAIEQLNKDYADDTAQNDAAFKNQMAIAYASMGVEAKDLSEAGIQGETPATLPSGDAVLDYMGLGKK